MHCCATPEFSERCSFSPKCAARAPRANPEFWKSMLPLESSQKNGGWMASNRRVIRGKFELLLLLLLRLLRILLGQIRLRRVRRDARTRLLIAREERHERRNFKRHFLARRKQRHGLGLHQLDMIVPGVELDASAHGKRRDLVNLVGIQGWRRAQKSRAQVHSIPEVWVDQSRQVLRLRIKLLQEQAGRSQFVFVRRILQQLQSLFVGHLHLRGAVLETKSETMLRWSSRSSCR